MFSAVSCEDGSRKDELSQMLNDKIEAVGYTSSSYKEYEDAYAKALAVYENKNATALEIDRAVESLKDAVNALVLTADFSELKLAIEACADVDGSLYTKQTYETFLAALNSAKAVYAKDTSKQSEVNSATVSLKNAKAGLVLIPTSSTLQTLLQNRIDSSPYTGKSYKIYEEAYESAAALLQSGTATQNELLLAENLLKQTISALVPKGDTSALQVLLVQIEEQYLGVKGNRSPEERYAAVGYAAFLEIFEQAKEAVKTGDVSEEDLETLLKSLENSPLLLVDLSNLLDRIDLLGRYSEERQIYTEESYEQLLNAVSDGIVIAKKGDPTKEEIEFAVAAIDSAIESLEKRELTPDYKKDKPLLDKVIVVGNSSMLLSEYLEDYVSFFNAIERENLNFAYTFVDDTSVEFLAPEVRILLGEGHLKLTYEGTGPVSSETAAICNFGGIDFSMTEFDVSAESKLGTPSNYQRRTEVIFGEERTVAILSYENEDEGVKVVFEYDVNGNYITSIEILQTN
jgi:hypothetical protein